MSSLAAAALVSLAASAHAAPLPLELTWSAPDECPAGEQIERELGRITRVRSDRALTRLSAHGAITRVSNGYHLVLELTKNGASSQSQFDSPRCAPLQKVATLVLALAFGDGVELTEEPPAPDVATPAAPTAVLAPPAAPPKDSRAPPAQPRPGAADLSLTPWLAGVANSGLLASVAFGAELGLGLGGRSWSVRGRFDALPPVTAGGREGVSAQLSALSFGLGACARHDLGPARVEGCLGFDAGAVRARSQGAAREGSVTAPWFALGPSVDVLLPLTRPFALRAELGAFVPLTAARYDVEPLGTLYAAARFVPRGSLGVAVEL